LEYEQKTHLVYKHAISTISPASAVAMNENGPAADPAHRGE
jgi:sRNA-binding regulator protein Hfq